MTNLDNARAAELARLADETAKLKWRHDIVLAITKQDDSADAVALAGAFRYRNNDRHPDARGRWGPRMAPGVDGAVRREALADTPQETCDIWEAVVAHATHPRVLATLHDLLFERKACQHVGVHGWAAAEAYIAFGLEPSTTLDEVDSLQRALELVRKMKADDLLPIAVAASLTVVDRTLDDKTEPKPGVSLRLLETLVHYDIDDPRVDDLLARARRCYVDVWNTANTIDLQRRRAGTHDARDALDREEVQAYLDAAAQAEPFNRLTHLETAARIARERGVRDLGDEAVRALQTTNVEDLPFERFSTEIEIPRKQTERQIDGLLRGANWLQAAMRIVGSGPPSGDVVTNREQVETNARMFVFTQLTTPNRIGSDGIPRWQPTSEDEEHDHRMAEIEVMNTQFTCACLYDEAFAAAGKRFGIPDEGAITDAFRGNHVDTDTCAAIARALRRYYDGDYEAVAYTGLPLIERLARNLLVEADEAIFRVQTDTSPGQYPGLGALLELLRPYIDPSWHRYLRSLLASPNGMNLRNEALHGYVTFIDGPTAVAVLIGTLYLAGLRPSDTPSWKQEPMGPEP